MDTPRKDDWCYAEFLVPAEYKIIEKKAINTSKQKTVKEQVLVKEESIYIIPRLCKKDLTKPRLKKIRNALIKKGYEISNKNALSSDELLAHLKLFQKDHNLAIGFYTLETMEQLGVNFWWLAAKKNKITCFEKYLSANKNKTVIERCLCGIDIGKSTIRKIKKELKERGYEIVEINGELDDNFRKELIAFQKHNKLTYSPTSQSLSFKTLDALNIKY